MVLACNCSSVVANIELATGTLLDDGRLELVTLQPKAVIGWMGVAIDVATGIRNGITSLMQSGGTDFHLSSIGPCSQKSTGTRSG